MEATTTTAVRPTTRFAPEARNWWHDTPKRVRRESVRSRYTQGTWNSQRMFSPVPASRYIDDESDETQ